MSRPNISYPQPIGGSGTILEPSAMPRGSFSSSAEGSSKQGASTIPSRMAPNVLDSCVTRLLVTTKQLLQGLEQWAAGSITEEDVSDIYVKLGNGFEQCVTSFNRIGIATKELDSIPQDLRVCLEQALSEDPSQETLNVYLPDIRNIIFSLLNGLKQKQAQHKRMINSSSATNSIHAYSSSTDNPPPRDSSLQHGGSLGTSLSNGNQSTASLVSNSSNMSYPSNSPASRHMKLLSDPVPPGSSGASGIGMKSDMSSDRLSTKSGVSSHSTQPTPERSTSPMPPKIPSSTALAERSAQRNPTSRPAPPDAFRPPRRQPEGPRRSVSPTPGSQPNSISATLGTPPPISTSGNTSPLPIPSAGIVGPPPPALARGVQLTDNGPVPGSSTSSKPTPPRPERYSRDSIGKPVSRFSADSDITNGSPIKSPPPRSVARSPPKDMATLEESPLVTTAPTLPTLNLPASISLEDTTAATALGISIPASTSSEALTEVPPESRATLAALQRSEALERRASKRFSSYTFNKMLPPGAGGSPGRSGGGSGMSPKRPSRRDRPPPMPSLPEGLDRRPSPDPSIANIDGVPTPSKKGLLSNGIIEGLERSSSPNSEGSSRSVRVLKTPEPPDDISGDNLSVSAQPTPRADRSLPISSTGKSRSKSMDDGRLQVFLQIGKAVKKVKLELPLTLGDLQLLFIEKFDYDPGMDDFPDVYIRDQRTGIQFELESMEDLEDGCVLSLNIEPLDQVKQHFDHTFATLMTELKEMKSALDHSRRVSATPTTSHLGVSPSSIPRALPTITTTPIKSEPRLTPLIEGQSIDLSSRSAELQSQSEELQHLRRDLAIMRQVHVDFLTDTKESFGKLRTQNNMMREVVKTKMGGSRAILDNSKAKLEQQCQDTISAVENISDIIDMARIDAYKRFVTPSKAQMNKIKQDLAKATTLVATFAQDVGSVEPTWRATWQMELSRVMEEQKLLSHQTKLSQDLHNDIKDATEMLTRVSEFVDQRAQAQSSGTATVPGGIASLSSRPSNKGFIRPPSPDDPDVSGGGSINHLLMEIRTKESDPHQRLRAIEAQQKAREREKMNAKGDDEFTNELGQFVKGRKLKKTGGTDEAERMRQRRHEQTLKRMLTGGVEDGSNGIGPGILTPQTTGASIRSTGTTATFGGAGSGVGLKSPVASISSNSRGGIRSSGNWTGAGASVSASNGTGTPTPPMTADSSKRGSMASVEVKEEPA